MPVGVWEIGIRFHSCCYFMVSASTLIWPTLLLGTDRGFPLVFDHRTNEAQFIRLLRRRSRWPLPLCLSEDWWRTSAPPVFKPEFLCSMFLYLFISLVHSPRSWSRPFDADHAAAALKSTCQWGWAAILGTCVYPRACLRSYIGGLIVRSSDSESFSISQLSIFLLTVI